MPMLNSFKISLIICLCLQILSATRVSTERVLVKGDLVINGKATTSAFTCPNLLLTNRLTADTEIIVGKFTSIRGMTKRLNVQTLKSTHRSIDIFADLVVTDPITTDTLQAPSAQFNGVPSFQLSKHEDFETDVIYSKTLSKIVDVKASGWSFAEISSCVGDHVYPNQFLGGPCKLSNEETIKEFTDLPKHEYLKVTAKYHMFDKWQGEYGYMKINDEIVWTKNGISNNKTGALNICGNDHPDPAYNMYIMNSSNNNHLISPVEITIPHKENQVKISFGSSLKGDSCSASYGVDDVMIYVK